MNGYKRILAIGFGLLDLIVVHYPESGAVVELLKQILEPTLTAGFILFAVWGTIHAWIKMRKSAIHSAGNKLPAPDVNSK